MKEANILGIFSINCCLLFEDEDLWNTQLFILNMFQAFGVCCCVVTFILQFFCLHLDREPEVNLEPNSYPTPMSEEQSGTQLSRILYRFKTRPFLNLLAYDIVLIIAQLGNVSIFRGLWNMIDAFIWPGIFWNLKALFIISITFLLLVCQMQVLMYWWLTQSSSLTF